MLSYQEALWTIIETTNILGIEEKKTKDCIGQVTAEDITAGISLPMTANAGPDGYAVRSRDIARAGRDNPVELKVIGTTHAGYVPRKRVRRGTAMRIMTGSAMPSGADCVVMFEETDEPGNKNGPNPANPATVKVFTSQPPGAGMKPAGSTVSEETLVVPAGTVIGPAQISVLLTIGKRHIKVYRRPVLGIIATGDEFISPKQPLRPGKTYNSNSETIAAMVRQCGGIPRLIGFARDKESSVLSKLKKGLTADAIITTGGVSRGDYDLVRLAIEKLGTVIFSRVNMGPGRSFALGMLDTPDNGETRHKIPIFALSGPPSGCINNFELLVQPALLRMMGRTDVEHPWVEAVTADAVTGKRPMAVIKWTRLEQVPGGYRVTLNGPGGESILTEMATTNSITMIPEDTEIAAGDVIKVMPVDWNR
jgi:molybdopterin molybdotransferase